MIVISVLLLIALSGCAKSAGEAWFTPPKMPQFEQPNPMEMLCSQWDFMCKQGQQQYCDMYGQQCVPQTLQAKALILINDNAPASDVILGTDAAVILQRYNAVPNTKLDSEVYIRDVLNYDVVVRILNGDINVLYSDSVQFRDLSLELQTDMLNKNNMLSISLKKLDSATVFDLCELKATEYAQKNPAQPVPVTTEVALRPAGNNVYLGTFLMKGQSFPFRVDSANKLLRITLPDKTLQDIALYSTGYLMGTWNYQGMSIQVKIDIQNKKAYFTY